MNVASASPTALTAIHDLTASSLFFMSTGTTSTNPAVISVLNGTAPHPVKLAAARGVLPLPQSDLLELLVGLADGSDPELARIASGTITAQEPAAIEGLVRSNELSPAVLSHLLRRPALSHGIYESLILNRSTPPDAIAGFAASTTSGPLLELVALNQQLLIQNPQLIQTIVSNPNRTAEAERRALETRKEFFEKERGAQQIASELRAQGREAAAEFIENSEFAADLAASGLSEEDAMFIASHIEVPDRETDDSWLGLEYVEEIYQETAAQRQAAVQKILGEWKAEDMAVTGERVSMLNRIMKMGVKDRVKLATKGDREARNILIRDPNRLVAQAVANNPRITEQEVETIAAMRSIPEDVLRQIATNRQWMRNYSIMINLAKNPRTPISASMTIMNRMQVRDLVALAKNRNVSDAVRKHAQRLANARTGNKS